MTDLTSYCNSVSQAGNGDMRLRVGHLSRLDKIGPSTNATRKPAA